MNSSVSIRDEERLLLDLCRLKFTEENLQNIKALMLKICDWRYFINLANNHGVSALVYFNLDRQHLLDLVPLTEADFLRKSYLVNLGRNTYNASVLKEGLQLFSNAGIKIVLLKGMALEHTVYGNAGIRQMSDIDLLVSRTDCLKARDLLLGLGYKSLPVKSVFHKPIITYSGKHLPALIRNGAALELHLELFGDRGKNLTARFFNSSSESKLMDEKVFLPQQQLMFLYLVRHLWYHELNNESQLRLYTDLIVLLEANSAVILNDELLRLAEEAELTVILADRLRSLRDLCCIIFPLAINDFIDKFSSPDSNSKFLFFLKSPKNNPPKEKQESYRQILNNIPGFHRKFLFVLGDLLPGLRFMKERYKCKSNLHTLIYYPHRLGKLFWLIKK
jgi:hypothetical protein